LFWAFYLPEINLTSLNVDFNVMAKYRFEYESVLNCVADADPDSHGPASMVGWGAEMNHKNKK